MIQSCFQAEVKSDGSDDSDDESVGLVHVELKGVGTDAYPAHPSVSDGYENPTHSISVVDQVYETDYSDEDVFGTQLGAAEVVQTYSDNNASRANDLQKSALTMANNVDNLQESADQLQTKLKRLAYLESIFRELPAKKQKRGKR